MTDDSGLSRRQFVRALSLTGGIGLLGGAGTRAYLADGERYPDNRLQGREMTMDLVGTELARPLDDVDPTRLADAQSTSSRLTSTGDSGPSSLSVGPLLKGEPRSAVLALGVESCDAVELWLRLRLGRPKSLPVLRVASHIRMRIGVAAGDTFDTKYEGFVDELLRSGPTLNAGGLLTRCSRDRECRPMFLGFEWTLPSRFDVERETSLEFTADVHATQCSRTAPVSNPWKPMNQ